MTAERQGSRARQWLIALRGVVLEMTARRRTWPDKRRAAPLIWSAHLERWDDDRTAPVRVGSLTCRIRARDWFALRDVVVQDEYGAALQDLPPGCRAIDAGANVGLFSAVLLARVPDATVVSVEPSPDSLALLRENIAANAALRWSAIGAAVWRTNEGIRLATGALSSGRHAAEHGVEVPSLTLEALIARLPSPDLLKLDIEGAECEALAEGADQVLAGVGRLIVELHPARCDAARILTLVRRAYPYVYRIVGRPSAKPLIVATRRPLGARPGTLSVLP